MIFNRQNSAQPFMWPFISQGGFKEPIHRLATRMPNIIHGLMVTN